jgi:hypothetical protein
MKSFLSLSLACILLGFHSANSFAVEKEAVSGNGGGGGGIASHFPSHIVKLKANSLRNSTGKYNICIYFIALHFSNC